MSAGARVGPLTPDSDDLQALAASINAAHEAAGDAARTAVETAVSCGEMLLEAKQRLAHGEWITWIEANLSFSPRQAQKYLRLAQRVAELPNANSNSHLTIDGALKLLAAGDNSHFRTSFTGQNEWYTPLEYLERARQVLGRIDLDPASSDIAQEGVQAARYFTQEDDGLSQPWHGRVWLNPPYSQPDIVHFIGKLVAEFGDGHVEQAILLTHNYTDTAWFHQAVGRARAVCFTKGRVKFYGAEGEAAAPTNGSTFFYFGCAPERFAEVFAEIGAILWPGDRA